MTGALIFAGALVLALAWRAHVLARRERAAAARLNRMSRRMDERAAQATLRPRTGDVVVQLSTNGHR